MHLQMHLTAMAWTAAGKEKYSSLPLPQRAVAERPPFFPLAPEYLKEHLLHSSTWATLLLDAFLGASCSEAPSSRHRKVLLLAAVPRSRGQESTFFPLLGSSSTLPVYVHVWVKIGYIWISALMKSSHARGKLWNIAEPVRRKVKRTPSVSGVIYLLIKL